MTVANKPEPVALAMGEEQVPHHWAQGPLDVRKLRKTVYVKRATQDGTRSSAINWEFLWYLNDVEGTTRAKANAAIRRVLYHPLSWERSGCRWRQVWRAAEADILVNVIPQDKTVCGPGSSGCYSWGFRGPKPIAEMGVEFIDNPPSFAELVNMELCGHGTFRMHDMYAGQGHDAVAYTGCMGTWHGAAKTNYYPDDDEITAAKLWLEGQAKYVHEHSGDTAHDHSHGH